MPRPTIYEEEPDCYELWITDEDLVTEDQKLDCEIYNERLYNYLNLVNSKNPIE